MNYSNCCPFGCSLTYRRNKTTIKCRCNVVTVDRGSQTGPVFEDFDELNMERTYLAYMINYTRYGAYMETFRREAVLRERFAALQQELANRHRLQQLNQADLAVIENPVAENDERRSKEHRQQPRPEADRPHPQPEAHRQQPQPEAHSQQPRPEAYRPRPQTQPEAHRQQPQPEAHRQQPQPEAHRQQPQPEAHRPQPQTQPEAYRQQIQPEVHRQQPRLEAHRPKLLQESMQEQKVQQDLAKHQHIQKELNKEKRSTADLVVGEQLPLFEPQSEVVEGQQHQESVENQKSSQKIIGPNPQLELKRKLEPDTAEIQQPQKIVVLRQLQQGLFVKVSKPEGFIDGQSEQPLVESEEI